MAKMFYTIQETAEKLSLSEDEVRDMAGDGKLQQFRDGDKLMFKRDQIDGMAEPSEASGASDASGASGASDSAADEIALDESTGPIELADSSDTDAIGLAADLSASDSMSISGSSTGINVFDGDSVEISDPLAQTQMDSSGSQDDSLALESVGSGSGLLDLTRESDDTSLGAELLDEIYPGGEGDSQLDTGIGASGTFESSIVMEATAAGLEAVPAPEDSYNASVQFEQGDPAWSGLTTGLMFGALASIIVSLIVAVSGISGTPSGLTKTMSSSSGSLMMYIGILAGVTVVCGLIGMFLGKMGASKKPAAA